MMVLVVVILGGCLLAGILLDVLRPRIDRSEDRRSHRALMREVDRYTPEDGSPPRRRP
jgi:hypothetical protein